MNVHSPITSFVKGTIRQREDVSSQNLVEVEILSLILQLLRLKL